MSSLKGIDAQLQDKTCPTQKHTENLYLITLFLKRIVLLKQNSKTVRTANQALTETEKDFFPMLLQLPGFLPYIKDQ